MITKLKTAGAGANVPSTSTEGKSSSGIIYWIVGLGLAAWGAYEFLYKPYKIKQEQEAKNATKE